VSRARTTHSGSGVGVDCVRVGIGWRRRRVAPVPKGGTATAVGARYSERSVASRVGDDAEGEEARQTREELLLLALERKGYERDLSVTSSMTPGLNRPSR